MSTRRYSWRRTTEGWETVEGRWLSSGGWTPEWKIWREACCRWWAKARVLSTISGPYESPRQAHQHLSAVRGDDHDTAEFTIYPGRT